MSKDDFRDRLKSYSSSPDPGEWSKMEQLLDADKDNHKKVFPWWRFGAALLLLGVAAFVVLERGNREPRAESRDGVAVDENTIAVQEEIDFVEGSEKREVRSEKRDALVVQERGKREPRAESRDGVAVDENTIAVQEEIDFVEGSEKLEVRGEKRDALVVQERGKREPRAESRDGVAVDENTIAVQEEIDFVEGSEKRDALVVQERGKREPRWGSG